MIKNFKRGLLLTSAFIISVMSPAMALPQNVQMVTESTMSANGQKLVVNSTVWYGDKKVRVDSEITTKMEGMPAGLNKSTMVFDSSKKVAYMMTPMNKTAIKIDSSMMD